MPDAKSTLSPAARGRPWHRTWRASLALLACLGGCALQPVNTPRNQALPAGTTQAAPTPGIGNTVVALSFSGGGLRAAAFSYGVLEGLRDQAAGPGRTLLDDVGFVTSVSGGSLTAAYFGLHGVAGLPRFRAAALDSDGESALRLSLLNPVNLARLLAGGLNDRSHLHDWLEGQVFQGATFGDMLRQGKPVVWINATNAAQRIAFPFHERAFDAICSDFARFPVSDAVAASMAVPVLFAPVVLEKFPEACTQPLPPGLAPRPNDEHKRLRAALSRALRDFRDPSTGRYVKLIDGGLSDNLGLVSILQSRILLNTPYGPLYESDAVRLRRMLFVVVDAGQGPRGKWGHEVSGPSGVDLASAAVDTAIESTMRMSYANFAAMMRDWQQLIVAYRCALPPERQAAAQAADAQWRCDDVQFSLTQINFDDLGPEAESKLSAIPTRLKLSKDEVDLLIAEGRRAVGTDPTVRRFATSIAP